MTTMKEVKEWAAEARRLQHAKHENRLHETEEAKADQGEMYFCPGCRYIVLMKRLREIE